VAADVSFTQRAQERGSRGRASAAHHASVAATLMFEAEIVIDNAALAHRVFDMGNALENGTTVFTAHDPVRRMAISGNAVFLVAVM
jgi:hypothetical protein